VENTAQSRRNFGLVALVLTVDAMAMAWIEGGQPDPFQGLGQEPPAQRRS